MFHSTPTILTLLRALRPNTWGRARSRPHLGEQEALAQSENRTISLIDADPNLRLRWLKQLRTNARIEVLRECLATCPSHEAATFAGELVEIAATGTRRYRLHAFRVLACRFAQIGETDRQVVVRIRAGQHEDGNAPSWASLLSSDDQNISLEDGASIALLAGWTGETELLSRLVRLASHPDERVAYAVDQSIERLISRLDTLPPHAARSVSLAVSGAIDAYEQHRRRGVLRAAARLWGTPAGLYQLEELRADNTTAGWWADASHPAQLGLRSLIRRDPDTVFVRAALTWLRIGPLAAACRDRLLEACSAAEQSELLAATHVLAHPARKTALEGVSIAPSKRRELRAAGVARSGINEPGIGGLRWLIEPAALARLHERSRRFAPAWIEALPMPDGVRKLAYAAVAGDPSEIVRHAVVRAATRRTELDTLSDFCFDPGAIAAGSATTARLCLRPPVGGGVVNGANESTTDVSSWIRLTRSSHPGVRRVALAAINRYAPSSTASAAHVLILRRRARRGRPEVLAELKESIHSSDESSSVAAIRTAMRLGVISDVRVELIRALWGASTSTAPSHFNEAPPDRIAATAAAALGDCDDGAGEEALRACLNHHDARVRSNALEALSKRSRRAGRGVWGTPIRSLTRAISTGFGGAERIVEFKHDNHHRVRGTVGWLALQSGMMSDSTPSCRDLDEAVAATADMLRDDREGHLLAGLWLCERVIISSHVAARRELGSLAADLVAHQSTDIADRAVRCVERSGVWESTPIAAVFDEDLESGSELTEAA